ncbi:MAG: tripartite tricarboxylate transporter substrate binding protein [Betaproteobacteria bacterium]|jgi:tripartite-type tricarboxylate transporter receptor subunit TctC|nr:tripartite tricarboxylate transporter substrate binding protein [Betaproteobacteria bacterium]
MIPFRIALATALATVVLAVPALAQEYPTKPVRILVPYPPGGASDVTARILADKLARRWGGKAVFVENKAGANGVIGTETIARADPDGHTIGLVASSHVTNHALMKAVPYQLADMVPVTITAQVQLGLVVNPAVPAQNVRELVAYAKANPNKLAVATSGRGSNPQLWALAFQQMTDTKMVDVPYKGSGAAHPDLLAGQTQVMFDAVAAVMPHVKAGKLRLLAVGGAKRSPFLPETPTMVEAGVPGYVNASWGAIIAPARTPKAIIDRLNADIVAILNEPDTKERLAGLSAEVVANSPAEAAAFMNSEEARLSKLIRDVGITPE